MNVRILAARMVSWLRSWRSHHRHLHEGVLPVKGILDGEFWACGAAVVWMGSSGHVELQCSVIL
eukprot:3951123-Lingulodinium_polyedra.AAC.1